MTDDIDLTSDLRPCARGCTVTDRHATTHPDGHDCTGCLPNYAIRGSLLCGRCRRLFQVAVRALADFWPELRTGVSRQGGRGSDAGKVQTSGHGDVGDMWRPRVTAVMDDVTDWASFCGRVLADDRRNNVPNWPTDTQLALRIIGQPAGRYLVDHPVLGASLVDDALRYRLQAFQALQSNYVRRIPLAGYCLGEVRTETTTGEQVDVLCGAPLVAVLYDPDTGRDSTILCSVHPAHHRVAKQQWAQLADDLEALRA